MRAGLPPIRTSVPPPTPSLPPRRYWDCSDVPTPELEQHIGSLMYEWMRTHRIAMTHWDNQESWETVTRSNPGYHRTEWERYRSIAGYCQHRVFALSNWPLPNPGLGFFCHGNFNSSPMDQVFSPAQKWTNPQKWDETHPPPTRHVPSSVSAPTGCPPPPADEPQHSSSPPPAEEPTFPLTRLL